MLENSSSHIQLPIDCIPLNIAVFRYENGDFTIVNFNAMAENTEKLKKEDILGKAVTKVFPGIKEFGLFDVLLRVYESGKSEELDINFYQDERIQGWRKNKVVRLEDGCVVALYNDLSKEKEMEEESSKQKNELAYLGEILDKSLNEVYIFDAENLKFSYINEAVESNLGYTLHEIQNLTPVDIKPQYNLEEFSQLIKSLIEGEQNYIIFNTIHQRKDGTTYDVEIRLQYMQIHGKKQCVVIAHDISQRVALEKELKKLATTDSLTGISNRHMMNEELDKEIRRARRYDSSFGLLMFDIDFFKEINDNFGHDVGDAVLVELCDLISAQIRESDNFSRWGGEEFLLLLPNLNEEQLLEFAEKLRRSTQEHIFNSISELTISIGCTVFKPTDTKELLLKNVDNALYLAKDGGRNVVKFL